MQVLDRNDPLDDMFSLNRMSPLQPIELKTYRLKLWFWFWIILSELDIDCNQVHIGSSHPYHKLSRPMVVRPTTYPGSLTNTGETSSTSALPSPAFPLPYPVSSWSSLRAVVLYIRSHSPDHQKTHAASSPSSIKPAGNSISSA